MLALVILYLFVFHLRREVGWKLSLHKELHGEDKEQWIPGNLREVYPKSNFDIDHTKVSFSHKKLGLAIFCDPLQPGLYHSSMRLSF